MTSKRLDFGRAVRIDRVYWDVPVRVPLRPYVEFCRWMDGELGALLARWDCGTGAMGGSSANGRASRRQRKPR
ncbi:MAG: hypothetical protein A2V70_09450 [Planctomycetes bacterium RBG_13_63_9]|nr:MAG: hypothetical protein A2V70_09450 [Planctomycetes bacterium RBG_13_63_9]